MKMCEKAFAPLLTSKRQCFKHLFNPQARMRACVHAFGFCTKAFVAVFCTFPVKSMQIIPC